ncbi:DUF2500 family protein [Corallococcus sp. AB049A]|nr:DUF2500 family protein [Corallococcus sp. AB050B]RKI58442.1 DUF2500 family protein [Corallococcus sp. AB049A]
MAPCVFPSLSARRPGARCAHRRSRSHPAFPPWKPPPGGRRFWPGGGRLEPSAGGAECALKAHQAFNRPSLLQLPRLRGPQLQEREDRPHLLVAAKVADPRDRPCGGESMEMLIKLFFVCMVLACIALAARIIRDRLEPELTRQGRVVAKRQAINEYARRSYPYAQRYSYTQSYFVTFEFQDGSRDEFETFDSQYGLLAEGDQGTLITRGRWLQEFARQPTQQGQSFPRPVHT